MVDRSELVMRLRNVDFGGCDFARCVEGITNPRQGY